MMAVIGIKEKATLKLELNAGIFDGKQKIKSKSFNRMKTDASDESAYEVAQALGDLYSNDLLKVKRIEETLLSED